MALCGWASSMNIGLYCLCGLRRLCATGRAALTLVSIVCVVLGGSVRQGEQHGDWSLLSAWS